MQTQCRYVQKYLVGLGTSNIINAYRYVFITLQKCFSMFIPAGHICGKLHNLFPIPFGNIPMYLFLIERQMQPRDVDLSETNFKVRSKLTMYLPEN